MRLAEEFISPIEQTIFEEAGGDAYDVVQEQALDRSRGGYFTINFRGESFRKQ